MEAALCHELSALYAPKHCPSSTLQSPIRCPLPHFLCLQSKEVFARECASAETFRVQSEKGKAASTAAGAAAAPAPAASEPGAAEGGAEAPPACVEEIKAEPVLAAADVEMKAEEGAEAEAGAPTSSAAAPEAAAAAAPATAAAVAPGLPTPRNVDHREYIILTFNWQKVGCCLRTPACLLEAGCSLSTAKSEYSASRMPLPVLSCVLCRS